MGRCVDCMKLICDSHANTTQTYDCIKDMTKWAWDHCFWLTLLYEWNAFCFVLFFYSFCNRAFLSNPKAFSTAYSVKPFVETSL